MLKRLFTPLLSILIVVAVVVGYYQFKAKNTPVSPLLSAIPQNALLIVETNDAAGLWEKFTQTSVIWEELKHHHSILEINKNGNNIDSLLKADEELMVLISNKKALMAVLPTGAETFSAIFAINTPADWKSTHVQQKMMSFITPSAKTDVRSYNGVDIHHVSENSKSKFYWTTNSGLLLIGTSQLLIEDALSALINKTGIINNESFKRVQKTTGAKATANIYLNYAQIGNFNSKYLNQKGDTIPCNSIPLASWSGLDLSVKSNQIMLNGFIETNRDSTHYFDLLKGQTPQLMDALHVLPSNTSFINYLGLGDFKRYHAEYKKWLKNNHWYNDYEQKRDTLNLLSNGDIEDNCLSWIESELLAVRTDTPTDSISGGHFLIFKTSNTEGAINKLQALSSGLGFEPVSFTLGDALAYEMKIDNAYGHLLGAAFSGFDKVSVSTMGNYVIIADSKRSLLSFAAYFKQDRTLRKDPNFNSFIDNVGDKSNLLIYSSIARSSASYQKYLEPEYADLLNQYSESIKKFEGFAYQLVNSSGELLYNNIFLRHNPTYNEVITEEPALTSNSLWRFELEASAINQPQLVINHNTNTREIVIQDANNTLYLISNTGKTLWKKKLDSNIMGRIHQIDCYKNGKLQLLFNTKNAVYLIDRNGKNVESFPVKLKQHATAPLGLFDYDGDKEYRILVACADKKLRLYDAKGQSVKGWNVPSIKNTSITEPMHLRAGNKDYLFVCDESGRIYLYDRQGKPRHTVKEKLNNPSENPHFVQVGKDIKSTTLFYTDTLGNLHSLGFDNKTGSIPFFEGGRHHFVMADIDADLREEIIIGLSDKVSIYKLSGELICSYAATGLNVSPVIYSLNSKKSAIGFCSATEQTIYLIDENCQPFKDFAQPGSSAFALGDINKDGILNAVVLLEPNILVVYNVE